MEISKELIDKIRVHMILVIDSLTLHYSKPACKYGILKFEKDEEEIFKEAVEWFKVIRCDFPGAGNYLKINKIGRFYGICPRSFSLSGRQVTFCVDRYDEESWRDWFDVEGTNDKYDLYGDMTKEGI